MTRTNSLPLAALIAAGAPGLVFAQASPFLTGVTSLQENLLEWLTPIAIILVMVLGGMAMANRIVENCGNTLILRCSGSDHGGTANFASRLIGQREVLRTNRSRSRRPGEFLTSITLSEHIGIEPAVMDSQIEQLPDLSGYVKFASVPDWQHVTLAAPNSPDDADTRSEARTFWQQWRASHAPPTPHAATRAAPASRAATTPDPSFARDSADHD